MCACVCVCVRVCVCLCACVCMCVYSDPPSLVQGYEDSPVLFGLEEACERGRREGGGRERREGGKVAMITFMYTLNSACTESSD